MALRFPGVVFLLSVRAVRGFARADFIVGGPLWTMFSDLVWFSCKEDSCNWSGFSVNVVAGQVG